MGFQLFQMRQQLLLIRQAREVIADHLVRSQRRLAARPQADQHAASIGACRTKCRARIGAAFQDPGAASVNEEPSWGNGSAN